MSRWRPPYWWSCKSHTNDSAAPPPQATDSEAANPGPFTSLDDPDEWEFGSDWDDDPPTDGPIGSQIRDVGKPGLPCKVAR